MPFERDHHGWVDATEELKAASPIQRLPMLDRGSSAKTRYVYDSKVIAEVLYRDVASARAPGTKPRAGIQQTLWRAELEEHDGNALTWIGFRKVFDVTAWPNLVAMRDAYEERTSFVATNP